MANRVTFLVDGFNLHYSLLEAQSLLGIARLRWLNADATCPYCGRTIERHEEKETGVSMGVKAVKLLHLRACDTLVIVSGDTDFAPALRTSCPTGPWERPAYRGRMHPMAAKHPLRHLLALGLPSGLAGLIVKEQSPPKTAVSRVPRGHGPGAFSFPPPR